METIKSRSLFSSLILSSVVAVAVLALWEICLALTLNFKDYVRLENFNTAWWQISLLILWGLFVAVLADKSSLKSLLPFTFIFLLVYLSLSFYLAVYWGINILFVRVFCITLLTILAVHLKKLWQIDSELTDRLVNLASTGHLLEVKSAEMRIESGLKLLETVLPLSEAIVFNFDKHGNLTPVGRARNGGAEDSLASRQTAWRENVLFCEQALSRRQTIVQTDENGKNGAQIALPLIYEKIVVGVLFVKIRQNFERADQYLLESFSGQLAQNFQRGNLRGKDLPHKFWWSFLSTQSAENRVGITSLIGSLMKEQTFSTVASSYLKEAHAIAYLDGTLAYLNRQMRHLIKFDSYQIHELDLFNLLEHFKTELFYEPRLAIRRVLQTGETYHCELYFAETNKTLDMQITLVKVPDDEQSIHETNVPMKPACFLLTFRDISAVKENEKLRSDMASLMSHELRTPITSIRGFTELLLMDETLSEESREFLDIISGESQRLAKMLTTFLSVSNLEQSDKQEFVKTPVRLDTVVHEVVGDLQENARQKRIRLIEQSAAHLPPIAADKGLISRAVSHLIDNAIKYSPEKTSVFISTLLESDFLRVVVEDRGYGIPKAEQEKIWQKFYRVARDGQDKEEESTGLGLSLVKEIIEQHGGAVEVESEIGSGSKFSFLLPRL
ncbi:MAG: ATP-binding protein [Pyrinomonadaceae bacterium]